jgi:penicillin amidase
MKIKNQEVVLEGIRGNIRIQRNEQGVPHISADNLIDLYYGLGFMHGHDRQLQMWLTKLIGLGKASENLEGSAELIEIDKYMRWINMTGDAADEVGRLNADVKEILEVYCEGVNQAAEKTGRPFEFKLVGYQPDAWVSEDIVLMGRMIGFIGLTQSQGAAEKLIIQMIQKGVDIEKIRELFGYMTDALPEEKIDIIKKVNIKSPIIPSGVHWLSPVPSFHASNSWAIGPEKTASGKAILCGDPHLEVNRLPSIWYEAVMASGDFFVMGATLPGVPFHSLGRSRHLAWGVTYAFMDVIDYFIEEVKEKKYRRGDQYEDFEVRTETIRPKKKDPIVLNFYENDLGVLEGEPDDDGYYLNFAWSARKGNIRKSLENLQKVPKAESAEQALSYFSNMGFAAFNWVVADVDGNIGYQMSGNFPEKAKDASGLLPFLAWDPAQHWKGKISPDKYPRLFNPEEGIVVSANEDVNHLGEMPVQNLPMAGCRADRIKQLLKNGDKFTLEDMKKIQFDIYSLQAEAFMEIIRPLLPDTENGKILKNWNLQYEPSSLGATLFERVYEELIKIVFGENVLGTEVIDVVLAESGLLAEFFGNFDNVLFRKASSWFGGKSRDEIFKAAIERGLKEKALPYGQTRRVMMANIFFGGKLPKFFGFDYGPIEMAGSRCTVMQGQIFKQDDRLTTFMPSYRIVCDLSEETAHTTLPGGPSDRRFSNYYTSDIERWLTGKYKILKP